MPQNKNNLAIADQEKKSEGLANQEQVSVDDQRTREERAVPDRSEETRSLAILCQPCSQDKNSGTLDVPNKDSDACRSKEFVGGDDFTTAAAGAETRNVPTKK